MPKSRSAAPRVAAPLPARAGVGLKPEHIDVILAERPDVGFFEIHAENYMGAGGPPHRRLEAIRSLYPLSLHGVGLSIGSPRPLDTDHLLRLCGPHPSLRTGPVLGASGLVEPRRGLPERPAAPALHRGNPGERRGAYRSDPGDAGRSDAAGEPLDLCPFRQQRDPGDRVPGRGRAPDRMRASARRQ